MLRKRRGKKEGKVEEMLSAARTRGPLAAPTSACNVLKKRKKNRKTRDGKKAKNALYNKQCAPGPAVGARLGVVRRGLRGRGVRIAGQRLHHCGVQAARCAPPGCSRGLPQKRSAVGVPLRN